MASLPDKAEKKSLAKAACVCTFCLVLCALVLLFSFGEGIGFPDWYDVFVFFKIYPDTKDRLSVSFISVGNADAIYIHENDTDILIDAGYDNSCKEIKSYLDRYKCTHFDAIFVSHPDSDHIGGMEQILSTYGTDTLYMYSFSAEMEPQTEEYSAMQNSIKENNISVSYLKAGDKLNEGSLNFEVISPQKPYKNTNDSSLVIRMTYGDNSFLFTGDISEAVESDLLNSSAELKSDVLKVAHHGNNESSSMEFLKAVDMQISVISLADYDNTALRFDVISRLSQFSQIYTTAADGTIVVTSDGKNLEVSTHA